MATAELRQNISIVFLSLKPKFNWETLWSFSAGEQMEIQWVCQYNTMQYNTAIQYGNTLSVHP